MSLSPNLRVRVVETVAVTPGVKRIKLAAVDGAPLPEFSGGAHTVVELQDTSRIIRNAYSLMSSPFDASAYEISVLRVENSRGGSSFIHDNLGVGTELTISKPVNLFPIDRRARRHLMIAGGIGITPFMAMMTQLSLENGVFDLHYAMRSRSIGAYWRELTAAYGAHRVHTYFDDEQQVLPLASLLDGQPLGTHLYVCGPSGMIDWVLQSAKLAGWPEENVHYERFAAPPTGAPFTVELAKSGKTITVGPTQSVLEAIEAAGVEAPFLCRGGACGQCETRVVSCDGTIEHNDHFLSEAERASGTKFMPCVSRFAGARLVLDV